MRAPILAVTLFLVSLVAVACTSDATETAPAPAATAIPTGEPTDTTATAAPTVGAPAPTIAPTATSAPAPDPTVTPTLPPIPGLGGQMIVTDIANFALADLSVPVGTTVLWTQLDAISHTTTSGTPGDPTGLWDSGTLGQGQTFTHTFTEEGSFPYFCRFHPGSMRATVTVVADTEGSNTTTVPEPQVTPTPTPAQPDTPVPTPTSPTFTPAPTPTPQPPPTLTPTPEPTLSPDPTAPPATESVTLSPSKDNTLVEDPSGALSNGAGTSLFVGRTGGNTPPRRRGVIAFDVSGSLPAGAIITSATLGLRASKTSTNSSRIIELHRLVADWGEGASVSSGGGGRGGAAKESDATWLYRFFDSSSWTAPGGDFVEAVSASTAVAGGGEYTWGSTPQMVSDVQGWVDDPSTNFGWLLMGDESVNSTAKRFDSRENSAEANRPVLVVEFIPG